MFVRYFVELDLAFDVAEGALLGAPEDWIPGLAVGASSQGQRLLAEVGFGDGTRVEKLVLVELARPIRLESKILLPMRWEPAGDRGLFPTMDGDIELAPLGASRTQLAMTARYTPPFGMLGAMADRALLHRVAEATVRDLVERIARGLQGRLTAAAIS